MYATVFLRDREWDIKYRVVEDDPSTNAFEIEWEIHGKEDAKVFGNATEDEESVIFITVCKAARDYDNSDDYIQE